MTLQIHLNAQAPVQRIDLGHGAFAITIDNFLVNPHELIDYACKHQAHFFTPEHGYPGQNLVLPAAALTHYHRFVLRTLGPMFGFLRGGATFGTGLSMVTFPEQRLQNFQRLCHTDPRDTPERVKFASMVYLFDDAELGGTAFYQWSKPDVIAQALHLEMRDPVATTALLAEHCAEFRAPPRYLTESNTLARQIAVVPPRFNRLIAYSGEIPHSGHITHPDKLSDDPRRGRLTLNCFASVLPG